MGGAVSGGAKQAHAEGQAERLLAKGLGRLQVGTAQLSQGAKGMPEKQVLAWWLCQRTTVSRRWVSERLGMGDESRVTQAIRAVKGSCTGQLKKLKRDLERATNEDNPVENE